jgi:hypothetical protein
VVPIRSVTRGTGDGDGEGDGDAGGADDDAGADGAAGEPAAGFPAGAVVAAPAGGEGGRVGSAAVGKSPQPVSNTIESTSHRVAFNTNRSLEGWAAP